MGTKTKLFHWGRHYAVGVEEIDQQHEALGGLLNDLNAAFREREPREMLSRRLGTFIQAASEHFAAEERLMRANRYPSAERHEREHGRLAAQVLEFQEKFEAGEAEITDAFLLFLKDWLREHVLISDRHMGEFLRTKLRS